MAMPSITGSRASLLNASKMGSWRGISGHLSAGCAARRLRWRFLSNRKLPLIASVLAGLFGASDMLACGPDFPWDLLTNRTATLDTMPINNTFAYTAARLAPSRKDDLHAIEPEFTEGDTGPGTLADALTQPKLRDCLRPRPRHCSKCAQRPAAISQMTRANCSPPRSDSTRRAPSTFTKAIRARRSRDSRRSLICLPTSAAIARFGQPICSVGFRQQR